MFIQVLPRSKLVRDPASFGYRRLLPFLNKMAAKNGTTTHASPSSAAPCSSPPTSESHFVVLARQVQTSQTRRQKPRSGSLSPQIRSSADLTAGRPTNLWLGAKVELLPWWIPWSRSPWRLQETGR